MKFGVIVFPGSNCDHDAYHVISKHVGQPVDFIWHRETDLSTYDAVILPGGFSYGDYLRAGALATTVAHDAHNIVVVGVDDGEEVGPLDSFGARRGYTVVADLCDRSGRHREQHETRYE